MSEAAIFITQQSKHRELISMWKRPQNIAEVVQAHIDQLLSSAQSEYSRTPTDRIKRWIDDLQSPKRSLSEKNICTVLKDLPLPEGFVLMFTIVTNVETGEEFSHYFLYNEVMDTVICIAPGQFVPDTIKEECFQEPGAKIKYLQARVSSESSSIVFVADENVEGLVYMVGSPIEILREIGVRYRGHLV